MKKDNKEKIQIGNRELGEVSGGKGNIKDCPHELLKYGITLSEEDRKKINKEIKEDKYKPQLLYGIPPEKPSENRDK